MDLGIVERRNPRCIYKGSWRWSDNSKRNRKHPDSPHKRHSWTSPIYSNKRCKTHCIKRRTQKTNKNRTKQNRTVRSIRSRSQRLGSDDARVTRTNLLTKDLKVPSSQGKHKGPLDPEPVEEGVPKPKGHDGSTPLAPPAAALNDEG